VSDNRLRELERQVEQNPANLGVRLQLAARYHQLGRTGDAVEQYRAVARAHHDDGRQDQAIAAARTALAIAPHDAELRRLVGSDGSGPRAARVLDAAVAVRELEPLRSTTPSGSYTPTPLPGPLPYHEADPSEIHRLQSPVVEDEDDGSGDTGETFPEDPTAGLSSAARRISERLVALSPPVPAPLEGDDLSSELETRKRPRVDAHALALDRLGVPPTAQFPRVDLDQVEDEPTHPSNQPGFEPGRTMRAVARLDDDAWTEEPTDPRDELDGGGASGVFDRPIGVIVAGLALDDKRAVAPGLAALPDAVRRGLIAAGKAYTLTAGTALVREGDPGESLFSIEAGEVRVIKRSGGQREQEVARLGPGAIVGEIAVMTDRRRHATVEAVTEVRVVEIHRAAIASAADQHPELAELLGAIVRHRLLSNLLTVAPLFAAIEPRRRPDLLARFLSRRVAAGTTVIQQGGPCRGLVLVVLGSLEVSVRRSDGQSVRIATIDEGGHIGELAMMVDGPEPVTVTAIDTAELAVLPARTFYQVVADDPSVLASLRAGAEQHHRAIAAALA
jgi:cAMP-dependent protein kinase regulator